MEYIFPVGNTGPDGWFVRLEVVEGDRPRALLGVGRRYAGEVSPGPRPFVLLPYRAALARAGEEPELYALAVAAAGSGRWWVLAEALVRAADRVMSAEGFAEYARWAVAAEWAHRNAPAE